MWSGLCLVGKSWYSSHRLMHSDFLVLKFGYLLSLRENIVVVVTVFVVILI